MANWVEAAASSRESRIHHARDAQGEEEGMAKTKEALATTQAIYSLTGTLLEACSCGTLCPCWIGEDPDQGDCKSFVAYHFESGQIKGLDVSGLTFAAVAHIPGNVLEGDWKIVAFVDEKATEEQRQAILDAFTGKLGGPLADMAGLIGEVLGVEVAPITHEVRGGHGTLRIPGVIHAEMEPYRSPDGTVTTLRDSIFSTVPGSAAWVGKAQTHKVTLPKYGFEWEYEGKNAIQAEWKMEHVA